MLGWEVWARSACAPQRHDIQVIYTELITFRAGLGWRRSDRTKILLLSGEREGTRAHLLRSDIIVVIFNEMKDFIIEMCLDPKAKIK